MSLIKEAQERVKGRLSSQAGLAGIKIWSRVKSDLVNEMEAEIDRLGITVFVFPPAPGGANPNLPGPTFSQMRFRVRIIENPIVNQTSIDAYEAMEQVMRALHNFDLALPGSDRLFVADPPFEDNSEEEVIFDVLFTAAGQFSPVQEPA